MKTQRTRGPGGERDRARWRRAALSLATSGMVALTAACAQPATTPPTTSRRATATTSPTAPTTRRASTTTRAGPPTPTAPARTTTPYRDSGNPSWSLVTEPDDGLGPIYSLMSSARHSLDMTMYELSDPQTDSILEADAGRGVTVRVILDQEYSGRDVNSAAYAALGSHGVQVHWAPAGTIFHQKTITVDDHTSAVMTLNLTSEYYSSTRDFAVITTDSADVAAIEQVFGDDWTDSGAPAPGPTATNLLWSPGAQGPILALINSAQHSLLIENEEMDDYSIVDALEAAARRGVDVEVVMTYSSDWASAFGELGAAGVKVRTYASDASLYIHAKVIVADAGTAFVGSQNFSVSSLEYNRELGIITSLPSLVQPLDHTVSGDFAGATPYGG